MLKQLVAVNDLCLQLVRVGSLWLARLGGLLLVTTIVMITVNIAARSISGHTPFPSTEFSGYILAISSSWAFAYAMLCKAHIRIDVAYLQLSQAFRCVLDILALVSFLLFAIIVVQAAWGVAEDSFLRGSLSNTPMKTPLWIPQALWVFGLLWFGVVIVLLLARVVLAVLSRDAATIQKLVGSSTLDEQMQNEGADT